MAGVQYSMHSVGGTVKMNDEGSDGRMSLVLVQLFLCTNHSI